MVPVAPMAWHSIARASRWYLPLAMAPLLVALAGALIVVLIDPYDLRPWGPRIVLTDEAYPQDMMPRLVAATANGRFTHVLVGGSTVMRVTPAMLKIAFGADKRAFNLSFPGIRPADMRLILERLAEAPELERLIVTLDATMLADADANRSDFPIRYYEPRWHEVLRDLDWMSLGDAVLVGYYGMLSRRARRGHDRKRSYQKPILGRPDARADLARSIERARGRILEPSQRVCGDIASIEHALRPALQRLDARGVAIDIFLPPYSLAAYADWYGKGRGLPGGRPETVLSDLMLLRHCVLVAVKDLRHVRMHGFDNDGITADLGNYRDTAHIQEPAVYQQVLAAIAAGTNVVTSDSWDEYDARLRKRVAEFSLPPG